MAIAEVDRIFLVGYSGYDLHLNKFLCRKEENKEKKKIIIVEWKGEHCCSDREDFWAEKGFSNFELIQSENILTFDDWTLY